MKCVGRYAIEGRRKNLRSIATTADSGAAHQPCKVVTSKLGTALATGACVTPLRRRGEFPPYAGNMVWRTVALLPLADWQLQPYACSVTIAASIDRAGVRPLLSAHKLDHESYRCS